MKQSKKTDGRMLFSVKDEEALVAALDAFSLLNRPLDKYTFLGMVRDMVPDDEWDPRDWFEGFKQRWSHRFSPCTVKSLSFARVDPATYKNVAEWVEWFPKWMADNGLSFQWIINGDETRLTVEGDPNRSKV